MLRLSCILLLLIWYALLEWSQFVTSSSIQPSKSTSAYNSIKTVFVKPQQENKTNVPSNQRLDTGFHFPDIPQDYHASGLLLLPHSGIAEPFEVWYAASKSMSRIDYYYGTDKTFQRGDLGAHGQAFKFVPMFNDKDKNFEGCYTLTGTKYRPIIAQTVAPNVTWFKYVATEVYTGTLTTKWFYEYTEYGMKNSQYLWISKARPYRPIRYEMKGYDMMLGSYYDHYVLEYVSFQRWEPDEFILEIPKEITKHCFNWSQSLESSLAVNPMQEFTSFTRESAVDHAHLYSLYKSQHQKRKTDSKTHQKKKHIFKHNSRYIHSSNRKNTTYKLAPNHFTDMTEKEHLDALGIEPAEKDNKKHKGIVTLKSHELEQTRNKTAPPQPVDVPQSLDWRDYGAVSSVKGQAICGSCYAFSAAGAAEGAQFLKTGKLIELSAQQIVDCSWGSGNHGCKGGFYSKALSWIFIHGISTDRSYGKYLGQEGVCHFNDTWYGTKIDAFAYVPSYNSTALKIAIARHGPAAVSINTTPLSFKFYSKGIYTDSMCWSNGTRHSALVVGYGKENGREYWLVKNSWSQSWGENGYIRIAMENDLCGITESPIVALMNHVTFQFPIKETIKNQESSIPITNNITNRSNDKIRRKLKSKPKTNAQPVNATRKDVEVEINKLGNGKRQKQKNPGKSTPRLLNIEPGKLALALKRTVKDLLLIFKKKLLPHHSVTPHF